MLKELLEQNFVRSRAGVADRRQRHLFATGRGANSHKNSHNYNRGASRVRGWRLTARDARLIDFLLAMIDPADQEKVASPSGRSSRGFPHDDAPRASERAPRQTRRTCSSSTTMRASGRCSRFLDRRAIASRRRQRRGSAGAARRPRLRPHRTRCDDARQRRFPVRDRPPAIGEFQRRRADPDADGARRRRRPHLGLEAGVDDYLAKPFEPRELSLRIAAILRRARRRALRRLRRSCVSPAANSIPVAAKCDAMARSCADRSRTRHITVRWRPGTALVSRAELGQGAAGERTVVDAGDAPSPQDREGPANPDRLQTVRGAGYRLLLDERLAAHEDDRTSADREAAPALAPLHAWLRGKMPKGLFARSLMIVVLPMLLQTAVAYFFMERHWQAVTHRLSAMVVEDVAALIDIYENYPQDKDNDKLARVAERIAGLTATVAPRGPFARDASQNRSFPFGQRAVRGNPQADRAAVLDRHARQSNIIEIRVQLKDAQLRVFAQRAQAYAPNSAIFLTWMVGLALLLIGVAVLFLRNQIKADPQARGRSRSLRQGARHAVPSFRAREVRQAGVAFLDMKRRVERAIEQRTAMLNGVSHDLRTVLTRFSCRWPAGRGPGAGSDRPRHR